MGKKGGNWNESCFEHFEPAYRAYCLSAQNNAFSKSCSPCFWSQPFGFNDPQFWNLEVGTDQMTSFVSFPTTATVSSLGTTVKPLGPAAGTGMEVVAILKQSEKPTSIQLMCGN